jgi:Chromo (CHRromatin Organisation MOdifier) domain
MKHIPHELITGTNPPASISIPKDPIPATQDYLKELNNAQLDAQKVLQRHIKPFQMSRNFVLGDKVWLDACNLKLTTPSKKLTSWRYGPFKVLQKISPVTYQIKLPQMWKIHNVFHVDLLTPYYKTQAYRTMHSQPPPELIDSKEEYEVEEIIDHRTFRQKKQYLVKWLGYPMSENSWVNKKDLHFPQLLQEYLSSRNPSDAQPSSAHKSGTCSCL